MKPIMLVSTWRHHGHVPPWRVQHRVLDEAGRVAETHGWEIVGTACGYDVSTNESDASLAIIPRALEPVPLNTLVEWMAQHTERTWSVS